MTVSNSFLSENYECVEALNVSSSNNSSTPSGGFVKGDPIKKTASDTGRECTANTDVIHGILTHDVVYPYTNKVLPVAVEGKVEVTSDGAGAIAVNDWVGLSSSAPRKFTKLTASPTGSTYRQAVRAKSAATANDGDKFIIDLSDKAMILV